MNSVAAEITQAAKSMGVRLAGLVGWVMNINQFV